MKREFKKYQHVERVGTSEVEGIERGTCYIFPKIDGTNSSLWLSEDKLCAGSRTRELSLESDNAGFYNWSIKQQNILAFFESFPHMRLYGEWLVPHSIKTYDNDAWRQFYVFDVVNDDTDQYLTYEEYTELLNQFGINYIPCLCKVENPTYEQIVEQLDKNHYLISDENKGIGEGVVMKNYQFVNRYGRTTWGKIVTAEFKARKGGPNHGKSDKTIDVDTLEQRICEVFITEALVEKEVSKITNEMDGWDTKYIPRLLNTIYNCLVTEEMWNILKKYKNPTINFSRLQYFCNVRTKQCAQKIF